MKKKIQIAIYIVMALSLIACGIVGVERIQVERNYKDVQITIRYNDVLSIAQQTDSTVEEVLKHYKDLGVTTLLARENTVESASASDLYSYKAQGEVNILDGYVLKFYYPAADVIKPEKRYIVTEREDIAEAIYTNYTLKGIGVNRISYEGTYFLEVEDIAGVLTTVGVGFNLDDLNLAASLGYTIAPQIKNWTDPTPEALTYLIDEISQIDNVGTIYFSDTEVPGANTELMKGLVEEHQLGFIEFTTEKQKGFSTLAKSSSESGTAYKVTRLHTLTDSQAKTYSIAEMMDRFELALRERNLRTFLFKLPNTLNIEADIAYLDEAITKFTATVQSEGYTINGDVVDYNLPVQSPVMSLIVGMAAIMIFILVVGEFGFIKTGYILGLLGLIGYAGLLKLSPNLALKGIALLGASMFPTYAIIVTLREKPRNIKETILALLKICIISYGGVLTTIGALSRTSFGLGIDVFMGVKVAHIIPIALVLIYVIYKEHGFDFKYYKGFLDRKITYGALLVIGVVTVALYVYTSRTGNSGSVSTLELQFRQLLTSILGVRPRTKEFLIGYPILMCLLYYGYSERYLIFVIFAVIGPISLVNTYAHIHTPILISMLRSVYGIIIGIIIGLIAIWLIKELIKVVKKWNVQTK